MSLSLVPLITKEKMQNSSIELKEKIQFALKISILVGVGATMGLYSIIKPTNIMLFENEAGSQYIGPAQLVNSFCISDHDDTAILQGLGHTLFPAIMVVVAFLLKYSLNVVFVPKFGAFGAALASVLVIAHDFSLVYCEIT